jgi:hypothetical protein
MINKILSTKILTLTLTSMLTAAIADTMPVNITMSEGSSVVAAPSSDLGNFGDGTVYDWLTADVAAYNSANGTTLPTPTANTDGSPLQKVTVIGGDSLTIELDSSYDYIFLHWGGQGGGWAQAYYIGDLTGTFEFDAPPGGHPAVGGLSFYSFYGGGGNVPDGGNTAALLGAACLVMALGARKLKTA